MFYSLVEHSRNTKYKSIQQNKKEIKEDTF